MELSDNVGKQEPGDAFRMTSEQPVIRPRSANTMRLKAMLRRGASGRLRIEEQLAALSINRGKTWIAKVRAHIKGTGVTTGEV